jgi:hypothetical protein
MECAGTPTEHPLDSRSMLKTLHATMTSYTQRVVTWTGKQKWKRKYRKDQQNKAQCAGSILHDVEKIQHRAKNVNSMWRMFQQQAENSSKAC